jgi:heptaprenyl diphosphate synthase
VEAAAAYGFEVGMAFQLSDDLIDLVADPEVSGKVPGTDLREGVRTLPVLYALEDEAAAGGHELADLLAGPLEDADIARALELLRGSDGLVRARDEAGERVEAAIAHLAPFGDRPVVTALSRLAGYALDRLG